MKSKISLSILLACLLTLATSIHTQGQKTNPGTSNVASQVTDASFEAAAEKVVRETYAKLTRFSRAFLLVDSRLSKNVPIEESYLRFELSDFKVGPIQEILNSTRSDLRTGVQGEVIQLVRTVTTLNDKDPHVAYSAHWTTLQYAPGYDPKWTINDLLSYEPAQYQDVGGYALYGVTMHINGKVRSYRAIALFHNPYASVEQLKPTFWDTMVGSGGTLSDIWNEKRPAVGERGDTKEQLPTQDSSETEPLLRASRTPKGPQVSARLIGASAATTTTGDSPSLGPIVRNTTQDHTEHTSGAHGENIEFQGSCEAPTSTQQLCRVNFHFIHLFENGSLKNWLYRHKNRYDQVLGTQTGTRGMPISCYSAYGVATKNCLNTDCTFTASLVGSGLSMQMTGGDVWRGQLVHGHTCTIPLPDRGMCFESPIRLAKSSTKQPTPRLLDPSCCGADEEFDCINGGGEWNNFSCTCLSPIVIDVAGNGFDLTNAADGILFDLARTGVPEQVSWTSPNSDDAWLVLDRNGNGIIDDGKELFGSATPQPYLSKGESKNGFRALAMFDKPENGGNNDGQIDSRDGIFPSLKLWQDRNHNGVSEGGELRSLASATISVIELAYKESRRTDDQGNWFRYRAKVRDSQNAQEGRWAWDVFLQKTH